MPLFNVAIEHGVDHVLVIASGPAGLADLCGMASFGAEVARRMGTRRMLLDLLGAVPHLSHEEHIAFGRHAAQVGSQLDRIASVVPAAERVGTSERSAQDAGARLKAFTGFEEAIAWLVARE